MSSYKAEIDAVDFIVARWCVGQKPGTEFIFAEIVAGVKGLLGPDFPEHLTKPQLLGRKIKKVAFFHNRQVILPATPEGPKYQNVYTYCGLKPIMYGAAKAAGVEL